MSLADGALLQRGSLKLAGFRTKLALRRDALYVKAAKLWALLFSPGAKRILFSERPDWEKTIRIGFRRLPHQIEFGPISADSFDKYDIVVPLSLSAVAEARLYCGSQRGAYPLPSEDTVQLCNDKYEFNKAMFQAGFSQYIPKMAQGPSLTPPYILKKRTGIWGKDCYVIRNREDERAHKDLIADSDYFCQEFIGGRTEFATHILFMDDQIVKALNIRYEFDVDSPIKGQDASLLQVVCRCRYLNLWAKMLRVVKFEGLCCVNYKVANGQPFLLEINPRFGGSLGPYFFSFIKHLRA